MLITIVLDVFYREALETKQLEGVIDALDIPVSLVLIADVYLKYQDAGDKMKFVKKNMLLILSVLPISIFLVFFRTVRIFPLLAELPVIERLVAFERVIQAQHGVKVIEAIKELVRIR